jgi:fatty-acyl-CoA synthase
MGEMTTDQQLKVYRRELSPVDFMERSGLVHGGRVAVVDGDVSFTYAEWRDRSRRLASALRRAGIEKEDRVAFLAVNSEPLLLAHFAVPQAGGVLVAINTRLNREEVAYILDHSGASFLFVSPELSGNVPDSGTSITTLQLGPEFEDFLSTGSADPVESWLNDEEETIAIDYTSGTTGRSKGVMYSHRGAYMNALGMALENRLSTDTSMLWTLPMFHCNGWCFAWGATAVGAKHVCLPRIDTKLIWKLLDEEGITQFNAAPTVLIMLANDPAAHRLPRKVRVCAGGAPPSPTLLSRMEELNIDPVHLYGLTESYGPATVNILPPGMETKSPEEQALFKARQGVPHVTQGGVKVVDDSMRETPWNGETLGELLLRGNTVMKGYYRQPDATEEAFKGGWLHTGDIAVRHPDGYVELRDRKKDIIISGGENISTIEVEQAIDSHPAVLESAVIPIPDEKWGEVPKAFVTLKPGMSLTAEELIEYVRGRIARYKVPRAIEFGELPKTTTGKIQKFVLRDKEWAGRERRIQ